MAVKRQQLTLLDCAKKRKIAERPRGTMNDFVYISDDSESECSVDGNVAGDTVNEQPELVSEGNKQPVSEGNKQYITVNRPVGATTIVMNSIVVSIPVVVQLFPLHIHRNCYLPVTLHQDYSSPLYSQLYHFQQDLSVAAVNVGLLILSGILAIHGSNIQLSVMQPFVTHVDYFIVEVHELKKHLQQ